MKNAYRISFVILMTFAASGAMAQDQSQVFAGVGFFTIPNLTEFEIQPPANPGGNVALVSNNTIFQPTYFLDFVFGEGRVRPVAHFHYTYFEKIWTDQNTNTQFGTTKNTYYNAMVGVTTKWIKPNQFLQVYSTVYIGAAFEISDEILNTPTGRYTTTFLPTWQISPIGVEVGKKVGVFTELGIGYKGVVSFGFFAKF